ncbi:hypothetical protein G7Y89_g10271 [Cudoniella acicularis]|uniref:Uncharacterized protein n=1 Tax=Cudoniella acicularis TaxID=354080 RepID=A0A8H4RE61_9HELO|nr:hypothetical protein G7Y89_g10271 [Cudoniella acicularis]
MDASSCSIYTQLLEFQNDSSQHQLTFHDPNSLNQAYIQTLARGLGLEFEYSTITNSARITRRSPGRPQPIHSAFEEDFLRFLGLEQLSAAQSSGELPNTYEVPLPAYADRANEFRIQDEMGIFSPQNYDSMFSFESASPELDHPSHSVDENSHLNNFGLDLNNANRTGFTPEEQISTSILTSNVLISQLPIDATLLTQEQGPSVSKTGISEPEGIGSLSEAEMSLHMVEQITRKVTAQLLQEAKQQQQAPFGNNGSLETLSFSPHENEQVETQLPGRGAMEKSTFRSRRNGSRAGSTNSRASDSGRNRITKVFSRRGSVQEGAYPGYQVYDSRSTHSAASSIGSVASTGRRGPLNGAARALANAVKAVKACWRCKFLRKPCDVELPCASCPKGLKGQDNSAWLTLGCRRGELKDEMPDIKLCPRHDPYYLDYVWRYSIQLSGSKEEPWIHANESSQRAIARRQEALADILANDLSLPEEDNEFKIFLRSLQLFPSECRGPSNIDNALRTALVPLYECIYSIVWEVTDCPKMQSIFGRKHPMLQEFVLLRSAANYQAKYESDKLIALSLICLRTCLEAVRIKHECINRAVHEACDWTECKVESITNLETHLKMYLSELSQVFFKKDNLRIRRGLMELTCDQHEFTQGSGQCLTARRYLCLALKLFVATSSTYDPLMGDYSSTTVGYFASSRTDSEVSLDQEFIIAQEAAQQSSWKTTGFSSSLQYLQNIFEDSEDPEEVMQMYRVDSNRSQLNDPILDLTFAPAIPPGKSIYQRPNHDRVFCQQCDSIPEGFESEKALRMHQDREHRVLVKKWICM